MTTIVLDAALQSLLREALDSTSEGPVQIELEDMDGNTVEIIFEATELVASTAQQTLFQVAA